MLDIVLKGFSRSLEGSSDFFEKKEFEESEMFSKGILGESVVELISRFISNKLTSFSINTPESPMMNQVFPYVALRPKR